MLLLFFLLTTLCFSYINCKQRTTEDDWFVKKYQPEYIKKGDGKTYPRIGDEVKILYVYTHTKTHKEIFSKWDKKDPEKFEVGRNFVTKCLDDTILRMSKREKIKVFCHSENAYGNQGLEMVNISSNMNFYAEIKLLDVIRKRVDI